ncbi:CHASE2 domain-containing protein [Argonema antarcticum]|uniref:CHASE2 domain-containing protein n=1 Tax=Argonema antarcticum TaxID=2942763 RepID=UPI002012042C|nr:adenylate/guanylate cyclase domain-containing protein [Argonema antarcticum]MCL1469878.1 adenylate/guanylate cyclase domain-containing protein [Argonema antarcticum A004/B2]
MKGFSYLGYKSLVRQWRGVLITAPSIAGLLIVLRLAGLLQLLELVALDRFFHWRPPEPADHRIIIIGISESDLQKVGKWPFPDAVIAQLLEKVKQQQPRAIGIDIYRDLPVEPGHKNLVKVFQTTPNLIGVEKVSSNSDRVGINPPPELQKLGQIAAADMVLDADGKVRRGLLYLESKNGKVVPSLALKLAFIYLKGKGVVPQKAAVNPKYMQLGQAVFVPLGENDGGYVRTYAQGYQILMNFRDPRKSFRIVSLTDVLSNRVKADLFRDRIVLIGSTAPSLQDFFQTPYDHGLIASPSRTSGVEIHANLTSQFISAALNERPLIKVWSDPFEWLWILFWSGVGATLTWQWRYADKVRKLSLKKVGILILAATVLVGSSYVAFLWSWWIPVVPPFLAFAGSAVVIIGYVAHTAGVIRQIFGRYLSDAIVPTLLESPSGLKMGGERRKITVLVSDLRGFTALSERLSPEEGVKVLNIYLESMTEIITSYRGSINDFIGDGIMVIFGIPTSQEDDAKRAVACAVAMQLAMPAVNEKISDVVSLQHLEMGIGINTGISLLGNIGSEKRTKYTAIGSEVNLAFRIETYTKDGEVFISQSTLNEVNSIVSVDSQREVKPKGIRHPITIYEVSGLGGEYNLFLPKQEQVFFLVPEEIPLQYSVLDGKHINDTLYKGSLIKLSAKQALVRAESVEAAEAVLGINNIKLNFLTPHNPGEVSEDIYAKVLEKPADSGNFYIGFTSLPPDVKVKLDTLYKSISASG